LFYKAKATPELLNANYEKIAQLPGEKWMTEDRVMFEGMLNFINPANKIGFLVFYKANP
jgi:hypothetical protein